MLTLIKREVEDHTIHLLVAAVLSATLVVGLVALVRMEFTIEAVLYTMVLLIVAFIGCASLGAAQMYTDRVGRISAFLATLDVARMQILTARFVVGLLAILIWLVPAAITAAIVLFRSVQPFCFYSHVVLEVSVTVFLIALACYCIGLQAGWAQSKVLTLLASVVFPPFIMTLVLIKGFGMQAMVVLAVLIAACVLRIGAKFLSTPL
jgi:hypothetical protein